MLTLFSWTPCFWCFSMIWIAPPVDIPHISISWKLPNFFISSQWWNHASSRHNISGNFFITFPFPFSWVQNLNLAWNLGFFFNFFPSPRGVSFRFGSPRHGVSYDNFTVSTIIDASKFYIKRRFLLNDPKHRCVPFNMLVIFEIRSTSVFHLTKRINRSTSEQILTDLALCGVSFDASFLVLYYSQCTVKQNDSASIKWVH